MSVLDPILERADRGLRLLERIAAAVEHLAARPDPATAAEAPELWTVHQVAEFLQCSESDVYRKAEAGQIPRLKLGGKVRFDPDAVRAYARGEAAPAARVVPMTRGKV